MFQTNNGFIPRIFFLNFKNGSNQETNNYIQLRATEKKNFV